MSNRPRRGRRGCWWHDQRGPLPALEPDPGQQGQGQRCGDGELEPLCPARARRIALLDLLQRLVELLGGREAR